MSSDLPTLGVPGPDRVDPGTAHPNAVDSNAVDPGTAHSNAVDSGPADPDPIGGPVPRLLAGLVDDAAVFPPGDAPLAEAVPAHRQHRAAWYADLVGPLLVPVASLAAARQLGAGPRLGLIVTDLPGFTRPDESADEPPVVQVEAAVARRGEDCQPGLVRLAELAAGWPQVRVYAEIPLSFGLLAGLDTLTTWRAQGLNIAVKFRTGGLAAELFPSPIELAAVICACRDRGLPFKLTAGLHHAIRYTDAHTGFVHHGFLNVLVGTLLAAEGGEVAQVADVLTEVDPIPLAGHARQRLDQDRPLWIGYGSCAIDEPIADLMNCGLLTDGEA